MAKMTIDGTGTTNEPIGPLRYTVLTGRSARDKTRDRLLKLLHRDFPQTEVRAITRRLGCRVCCFAASERGESIVGPLWSLLAEAVP